MCTECISSLIWLSKRPRDQRPPLLPDIMWAVKTELYWPGLLLRIYYGTDCWFLEVIKGPPGALLSGTNCTGRRSSLGFSRLLSPVFPFLVAVRERNTGTWDCSTYRRAIVTVPRRTRYPQLFNFVRNGGGWRTVISHTRRSLFAATALKWSVESSPHHHTLFMWFILILLSHLFLGLPG